MKNKLFLACILLTSIVIASGCSGEKEPSSGETQVEDTNTDENEDDSEEEEVIPGKVLVISPLPTTIDVNHLEDCTVAVSLEEGGAFIDDAGTMQMKVNVYTYDLYDMVDIAQMKPGDTFSRYQESVQIVSLEQHDNGNISINGGLDVGGYELRTDDGTTYYETAYSDFKNYYEIGEVTLPVSADFVYTDAIDLDNEAVTYNFSDLMEGGLDYFFTPHNTKLVIEGGNVVAMERVYTP